jgi:hypothetical protein
MDIATAVTSNRICIIMYRKRRNFCRDYFFLIATHTQEKERVEREKTKESIEAHDREKKSETAECKYKKSTVQRLKCLFYGNNQNSGGFTTFSLSRARLKNINHELLSIKIYPAPAFFLRYYTYT